ncbi:MAG: phage holin family protein [Clostridium sp.]
MENLITFIPAELSILIASCYVLGIFLKRIQGVKDNYIPIALMIFCIIFSMVLAGFTADAFLQGILCWGVSVGINQIAKQTLKGEN